MNVAVGEYLAIDPANNSGCTVFPATGATGAEYLVVPQIAGGFPGQQTSFILAGDTVNPAAMAVAPMESPVALSPAEQFHLFLRRGDEAGWGGPTVRTAPPGGPLPSPTGPPPPVGDVRIFHVCATVTCSRFENVTATARSVKSKVAIYVDNASPAGGLDATQLDNLATTFDTRLYPTDVAAFGVESDIDANTVVIVLMTPVVNRMVTAAQCAEGGFVAGFFYGADLVPGPQYPNSNAAEIFYSIVPDPSGSESCVHSTTQVERLIPVTFIHEFQHMISFNQHVLVRGGNGEELWLNEGFSHYAEELGGRTYPPGPGEYTRFVIGNLFNAYQYLDSTGKYYLLPSTGIGSLAERGAAWLFVRFIVDRFSGGTDTASWNAFTRSMIQTNEQGDNNVVTATGVSFETVAMRWALANWVSDLVAPGFTVPAVLKYDSWSFRTTYQSLNAQDPNNFPKPFPLTPSTSAGRDVDLSGTLLAGSGVYHRVLQGPNRGSFTLHFTNGNGTMFQAVFVPRLNVIRIQ